MVETAPLKKLILCVDDEKIVLDSLKNQLKSKFRVDFLIDIAQSADEAFEIIEEYESEGEVLILVITDWLMPGMKGDEFLIKLHQDYPSVVKIMLTGQADEEAIKKSIEQANLYKCLAKPWSKNDLLNVVSTALNVI